MAFSGDQITRLGLSGITRGLYGDFTEKFALHVVGEGDVYTLLTPKGDTYTQITPSGDKYTQITPAGDTYTL
jgi:hypothetical protein